MKICLNFSVLFILAFFFSYVHAGTNKNVYTQIDCKVHCIYKQYEINKKYLSDLIIVNACRDNEFTVTQITIIKINKNLLKDIANEVGIGIKFMKDLNESLEICDTKLKEIRDNAIEDMLVSFAIKNNMTVAQIKKAARKRGLII